MARSTNRPTGYLPAHSIIVDTERGRYLEAIPDEEWSTAIGAWCARARTLNTTASTPANPEPFPARHVLFDLPLKAGFHTVSLGNLR